MFEHDLNDRWIRKDGWVKDLTRTHDPEELTKLIIKRIQYSATVGPSLKHIDKESPIDILVSFIEKKDEFRKKLTPAVGLILYKMINGEMKEENDILRGVFDIIHGARMVDCFKLVRKWTLRRNDLLTSEKENEQLVYRGAMMALARIQPKDKDLETYWMAVWRGDKTSYWRAAFTGLRLQNPDVAIQEIPRLIERNDDKTSYLLRAMLANEDSKPLLEKALRFGINNGELWSAKSLNLILKDIDEKTKTEVLGDIQKVSMN